jgi:hypothetical protein
MPTVTHLGFFPWGCITNASDLVFEEDYGPGTPYPIGVPLAVAMKWYWRVRSWRVVLQIPDAFVDFVFAAGGTYQTGSNPPGEQVTAPVSEKALVCGVETNAEGFNGGFFDGYSVSLFSQAEFGPVIRSGNSFFPAFGFAGALQTLLFTSANPISYQKTGTATIDGRPLDAYVSPGFDLSTTNYVFQMSPHSYWAYSDTRGPIYDTVSGIQLRAF